MNKVIRWIIAVFVLAAILAILAVVGFVYYQNSRTSETVKVSIKPGATTEDISGLLAKNDVIDNAFLFRLYVKRNKADEKLQAGEYHLETNMSYKQALDKLVKGPFMKYYRVVFPEGLTVEEIAETVDSKTPISKEDFIAAAVKSKHDQPFLSGIRTESLEGYLFPKTYTVTEKTTASDFVDLMLWQFQKETNVLDFSFAKNRGLDVYQIITIASMIEKEVQLDEERPRVSSVIYNRLDQEMLLQMCSTVQYVLPVRKKELTYSDLEIDSPYNTYKYTGIPPGPIANPGIDAIKAALDPVKADYLYFVLTGEDGSHTFTSSYEEFEKIKREQGR